jgi:predicted Zn-dependent protease
MRRLSRATAASAAALIAFASAQPTLAASRDGFSVSGKEGPFLKQISGRTLGGANGGGAAMGLASDAINQGQYQAARLRMPQTEAKVADLLGRIEANWPYAKDAPVQVHILGVDNYNAYALPDGSIIVGFGLLDMAQSDDELAFILAHELGHIRLNHFDKATAPASGGGQLSKAATVLAVGAAVGAAGGFGGMDSAALDATRRATASNDLLNFVNNTMVSPDHSREKEDEADALGFDLANLAPYAAETASARVFDTIQADEERRAKLSEALNGQLKKELGAAVKDGRAASLVMTGMSGGSLRGGLLQGAGRIALGVAAQRSGDGPKHRNPEERKAGIAEYSVTAYPDGLPLVDEQKAWLEDVRATPEFQEAKVAVGAVKQAMILRAAGDYPAAEAELTKVAATQFAGAPLVVNEMARVRGDMGDADRSDALFNQAHQSPDQTVDGYVDHVRMLYQAGKADDAVGVVDAGAARFNGDEKPFLSLLIAIYKTNKMDAEAEQYLQKCAAHREPGLTKDCELAYGGPAESGGRRGGGLPGLGIGGLLGR